MPLGTLRVHQAEHCCAQLLTIIVGAQLTNLSWVTKLPIKSEGMVSHYSPGFTAESTAGENTLPPVHRRCQRGVPVCLDFATCL